MIYLTRTTLSSGYLGSRNDEERSEMRYVMRIAYSVSHQIFERILRFRVTPGSMPLSVSIISYLGGVGVKNRTRLAGQ